MLTSKLSNGAVLKRCSQRMANSLFVIRQCGFQSRQYSPTTKLSADLPYHIVVGMPALSPTMETGVLAEWYISEGSGFSAGEAMAKIETDKASIDFEAQDDGFVAKIIMEAGTGEDIPVGTPIMVTVEEEDDVAAFANFVLEDTAQDSAATKEAPEPAAAAPAPAPKPAPPVVEAATAPSPAPSPTPASAAPPAAAPSEPSSSVDTKVTIEGVGPVLSTGWGDYAKLKSPIIKTLSKQQQEYIEKYGTTGHIPL